VERVRGTSTGSDDDVMPTIGDTSSARGVTSSADWRVLQGPGWLTERKFRRDDLEPEAELGVRLGGRSSSSNSCDDELMTSSVSLVRRSASGNERGVSFSEFDADEVRGC
jgi:hypothetical protein